LDVLFDAFQQRLCLLLEYGEVGGLSTCEVDGFFMHLTSSSTSIEAVRTRDRLQLELLWAVLPFVLLLVVAVTVIIAKKRGLICVNSFASSEND
jgi:hypothetical protein